MLLEPALVEVGIVEGAELRGQAAEGSDEPELGGDEANRQAEPRLAREIEPGFGLALDLGERIAGGKEVCGQVVAAICRKGEVAEFAGGIEGAPHQRPAGADRLGPGNNAVPEDQVNAGLEAT